MKRFLLIFYIIFILCFNTIIYAAPITPMPNGGVVIVNRVNCAQTDFPAEENTNISRGQALMSALRSIQTSDNPLVFSNRSIYLSPGLFDIGTSTIDLSSLINIFITEGDEENPTTTEEFVIRNIAESNNLHGSGKYLTTISSDVHGSGSMTAVKPSKDSQITDLSIYSGSNISDYSFPFGIGQELYQPESVDFGTVFLKNVAIFSPTDGIYFYTNSINMILNLINVKIQSGWDAVAIIHGTGLNINIYDSLFNSSGNSSLTNTNYHAINDISGANFNIYNSIFNIYGKNNVYGIYTQGITNIFNSIFNMELVIESGTLYSFFTHDFGVIKKSPSVVSNGVSSGNILQIAEQSTTTPTLPPEPCIHPFRSTSTVICSTTTVIYIGLNCISLYANLYNDGLLNNTELGFKYSIDLSYTNSTSSIGNFVSGQNFSNTISGLSCGTTYNYQIFAVNAEGVGSSTNKTFTTLSCPVDNNIATSTTGNIYHSSSGGSSVSYTEFNRVINIIKQENISNSTDIVSNIFKRNLYYGISGNDVKSLQQYLNNNKFIVSERGIGSSGYETNFFGNATKNALIKFQKFNNIKPALGYFGPKTRNFILNK